jgi:hypothetical protein
VGPRAGLDPYDLLLYHIFVSEGYFDVAELLLKAAGSRFSFTSQDKDMLRLSLGKERLCCQMSDIKLTDGFFRVPRLRFDTTDVNPQKVTPLSLTY